MRHLLPPMWDIHFQQVFNMTDEYVLSIRENHHVVFQVPANLSSVHLTFLSVHILVLTEPLDGGSWKKRKENNGEGFLTLVWMPQ